MPVEITEFPKNPKTSDPFVLKGSAIDLEDGEELLILVDDRFEVARPRVQNEKWQTTLIFNQGGNRRITVIASDQDTAEITLTLNSSELEIISRSVWQAKPPKNSLADLPNPKRITIHHTVLPTLSPNASTASEQQRMQNIQSGEMQPPQNFADIGYHYVIMPSGRIYEGRPNSKKGAHDVVNDGFGVALEGSFHISGSLITQAQFDAAVAICTMLCRKIGIADPTTLVSTKIVTDVLKNPTRFVFGSKNLPRICGHRDRFPTECPGMPQGKSVRLEEIRQAVKMAL
jgi:hypothetical protein